MFTPKKEYKDIFRGNNKLQMNETLIILCFSSDAFVMLSTCFHPEEIRAS
jgi:hypothetical protein